MNISLSNIMATGAWMAFLSVLAIIGIIVAGGFIVALLGKMVLSLINVRPAPEVKKVDEFGYSNDNQGSYIMQADEVAAQPVAQPVALNPEDDYGYGIDVNSDLARKEEAELQNELNNDEDDDFFNDFVGDDDVRFGDDDLMGMIDEISQDVLDEEEQVVAQAEQAERDANKSVLDKYSIDKYFDEEDDFDSFDEDEEDEEILESQPVEEEIVEQPVEEVTETVVENETMDEISALRQEVKQMIESLREDNDAKNAEFNTQVLEILNELKQANLAKDEEVAIENNEDAVEHVENLTEELEVVEKEMQENFREEMLHKDDEEKAELRAQMESYNQEISELKEQLAFLKEQFDTESENAKTENQALLDQLEAERQQRIRLEQEKLDFEQAQQEQLDLLRKENEQLIDRIQTAEVSNTLTEEEMNDLYSEVTEIDYSAISKMNEEQIEQKVKDELQDSKQEIEELKKQVNRLTDYIKEREDSLAEKINVHEVRSVDFDIEQIKQITAEEVEEIVKEKLIEVLAEVTILKEELDTAKQEIEDEYKQQLANTDAGMEYDRVSKLQESAEKIDSLNEELDKLTVALQEEKENIQNTIEQCATEVANAREAKLEEVKVDELKDAEISVVGPKHNKIALMAKDDVAVENIESIDIEIVNQLTDAEIEEVVDERLQEANAKIESLKKEISELKKALNDEEADDNDESNEGAVPVVRSPLFDIEMIKTITAQEVEKKVQERLAEAMKEIEAMKAQLEVSKNEIERQYKEEIANNGGESLVKDKLKGSAAEVIELKEELIELTEQIAQEHQEAQQNSEVIAEQLGQNREIAKQQLAIAETTVTESTEVMVIGPKNNQVALVANTAMLTEEVDEMNGDIPTIDIETVKRLTEQEIEEKVQERLATSIIEIEELKKQILNLSIQISEIKGEPTGEDEKPMIFHYGTEEAYLERLAVLEERLKSAKKDLKINNKELNPLEKVRRTLERDKLKLRRKYAIVAKKKVALYGVNNYVDIDKDKAEKLAQELELLEGLKLSVAHCEEVMNANVDRYPILVHTDKILRENIANIESDIETLNEELTALRAKNDNED